MESKAILKHIHISPQKTRLMADLIRHKYLNEAVNILNLSKKRSAGIVKKVLLSAFANIKDDKYKDKENVKIKKIYVDGGPAWKRNIPRARGRATPIKKRTSHITIVLESSMKA